METLTGEVVERLEEADRPLEAVFQLFQELGLRLERHLDLPLLGVDRVENGLEGLEGGTDLLIKLMGDELVRNGVDVRIRCDVEKILVERGRVVEVYGPESSGKTTLSLHIAAEAQKSGGVAAFIDAEHALDVHYAKKLGVNTDELLISQPDTGEQALEIVEVLVRSGAIDVMIIDSVAALVPRAEIEGEMGDSHMGLQARLMSQALRKLTGIISKSNCCVIFINQIRMKIGVMFGNPETTTGGNALKFYSSVRMDIRRIASLKQGQDAIGNRTRVKVVKNKVAPPFKEAEFDIMYGTGISREGDLVDLGVECAIVEKSGSWFSYGDERIGQGRENAKQYLVDHPETAADIESRILEHYGLKPAGNSSEGE